MGLCEKIIKAHSPKMLAYVLIAERDSEEFSFDFTSEIYYKLLEHSKEVYLFNKLKDVKIAQKELKNLKEMHKSSYNETFEKIIETYQIEIKKEYTRSGIYHFANKKLVEELLDLHSDKLIYKFNVRALERIIQK